MWTKKQIKIFQYLAKVKDPGTKEEPNPDYRNIEGAHWSDLIKKIKPKLTQRGLARCLKRPLKEKIIVKDENQGRPVYKLARSLTVIFPELHDGTIASGILFSELEKNKYDMTCKDMIRLRNKIGAANFVSPKYKEFLQEKSITKLDHTAQKKLIELMELLGYGYVQDGEFFKVKQIDEDAMKKAMISEYLADQRKAKIIEQSK